MFADELADLGLDAPLGFGWRRQIVRPRLHELHEEFFVAGSNEWESRLLDRAEFRPEADRAIEVILVGLRVVAEVIGNLGKAAYPRHAVVAFVPERGEDAARA